jgi:homoserine dehydrogenase
LVDPIVTDKPSRVALLGFGTVGQSVARILCSGEVPNVELTHVFNRQVGRKRVDWVPSSVRWTESVDEILASDVETVIELVGGLHPAYEWVRGALAGGKSVVTANKQLMAHFGTELRDLARAHGSEVRFEASVAGGIPVLRALQEGLAGDRLVEVRGILNGTCNYILSRMQAEPISFADALAEAQKAGYAEADPSEDLDGADAAAKLAIIAAVGLRRPVRVTDIATRSIRPIEPVDFEYARELGCTIRQIARASAEDSGAVFAAVRPALVPLSSGFGRVEGSQNLVTVRGVFGGETSFSGFGAGGSPTAVAVVSDVLSVCGRVRAAAVAAGAPVAAGGGATVGGATSTALHQVSGDFVAPHYVRFTVSDKPGILAAVCAAYARYGINIEGVLQLPRFRKDRLPFVTTLEECPESVLDRALAEVSQSDYHVVPPLALPIFA